MSRVIILPDNTPIPLGKVERGVLTVSAANGRNRATAPRSEIGHVRSRSSNRRRSC